MVWQSGGEKVMLNINNKAVQLVDYQQIEYMYNTIKDCNKLFEKNSKRIERWNSLE